MKEVSVSEPPFFSVIIVNYNAGEYLQKAIDSLVGQTFQDFETWIVDNDSSDGSMELLDLSHLHNASVIMAGRNTGFAEGNNIAARRANGTWIALLNCDAAAQPDWLEKLHQATIEYPETCMFASTQLRMDDPDVMDGCGDGYTAFGFAWRGGFMRPDAERPGFGECFAPCGASAVYRRDKYLAAGGFEESFFCFMEDVDLAFKLRLEGERCLYLPDAVVLHKGGGVTGEKSAFSVTHGARNRMLTYMGNMPTLLLILTAPLHGVLLAYLYMRYLGKPYGGYFRDGTKEGWARALEFRRQRKPLRMARKVTLFRLAQSFTWNVFRMSSHAPAIKKARQARAFSGFTM